MLPSHLGYRAVRSRTRMDSAGARGPWPFPERPAGAPISQPQSGGPFVGDAGMRAAQSSHFLPVFRLPSGPARRPLRILPLRAGVLAGDSGQSLSLSLSLCLPSVSAFGKVTPGLGDSTGRRAYPVAGVAAAGPTTHEKTAIDFIAR